jgi:hypothetical protein
MVSLAPAPHLSCVPERCQPRANAEDGLFPVRICAGLSRVGIIGTAGAAVSSLSLPSGIFKTPESRRAGAHSP